MTTETAGEKPGWLKPVTLGVFIGLYLALSVAWLISTQSNKLIFDDDFAKLMSSFAEFWAIVAAPLWFFTVLSQVKTFPLRAVGWAIGLVVLFPFPLFFGVSPL